MPAKTVAYFRPGQDITGLATTDVTAERIAYFATPPAGSDQIVHVQATRDEAGEIPAGVVGFAVPAGQTTHVAVSGVQPILTATEARKGQAAYADAEGRVTTDSAAGANAHVGVYVRPAAANSAAVVKLNLS
ncbi:DUF2190 family protein [Nesterenkonia flava]|uniref:DUF2190 family protein n=1 Tax=Nesterenkonia flava TaxID=469799 RepID=A0ABU1FRW7_9MICC|nr:DUF2190 family protein [Nesterenkonia flava]MDR5711410.1 DUF2190 family protein [Nesterenkonia flava]